MADSAAPDWAFCWQLGPMDKVTSRGSVGAKFEPKLSEVVVECERGSNPGATHDLEAHHVDQAHLAHPGVQDPTHRRIMHDPVHKHRRDWQRQLVKERLQRLDPQSALYER